MLINRNSGMKIAEAIQSKTDIAISQKLNQANFNKIEFGRITAKEGNVYTISIRDKEYTNILAYSHIQDLNVGDVVDLLVPNNRFLNLRIIGKLSLPQYQNHPVPTSTPIEKQVLWSGYWDVSRVNSLELINSVNSYPFIEIVFDVNGTTQYVQKFGTKTESSMVFTIFAGGPNNYWANIVPLSSGESFTLGTTSSLQEGDLVIKQIIGIN